MKPENLTVFQLFERQLRYVVPLFQRPYIWTREKQWEAFWEDIEFKADEVLKAGIYSSDDIHRHFLGAIVLNSERPVGFQVPIKIVVDGQQRITTMQIVMFALRDIASAKGISDIVNDLDLLISNRLANIADEEKFKVWPTNADQEVFINLYKAGSIEEVKLGYPSYFRLGSNKPEPKPTLVEAYIYFYEMIQKYVDNKNGDLLDETGANENSTFTNCLIALKEAFLKTMEIVTIDLTEKDNPQVIFESLNYLGAPLLASDLIRNFVFLEANRRKESVKHLYDNYWYEFDRPEKGGHTGFWKVEEKQGRLNRPRIDLFVFHYLALKRGEELLITELYKEFRTWWKKNPDRSVEQGLAELLQYSKIFKRFFTPIGDSRFDIFLNRLRTMEMSTAYPLLLFLLGEKTDISEEDLNGIALDLESYLIRRLVCGLTTKNYNKMFLLLLHRLRNSPVVNRRQLQKLLLEMQGDTGRWPNDDEFRAKWMTQPVYRLIRNRVPMLLLAIEQDIITSMQEKITLSGKLSIEHILPQKYSENDYPFLAGTGLDDTQMHLERDNLIHTLGNLTLLTTALNTKVSNGPFKVKKPEITNQSSLRLNAYFQNPDLGSRWNEINIQERGQHLFAIAIKIWPYPDQIVD